MRLVWSKTPVLFWLKYALFGLDCWLVKIKGIKLIWTIYNKFAHENQHKKRELHIRKLSSRMADNVIFHSQEALEEINKLYNADLTDKAKIIFHGNYTDCYPKPSNSRDFLRHKEQLENDDIILLFFGSLKPYKGIEILISAYKQLTNSKIKLYIAGEPYSTEYKEQLTKLTANCMGITTYFTYLNDQELIDHLHFSDAVVLPFSDTLTSGTAVLAMTVGKALILTETAKIFGCVPEKGASYFTDEIQLINILNTLNIQELKNQGELNFVKSTDMSWVQVAEITKKAYFS